MGHVRRGVIYIAYGEAARYEAGESIESLRRWHPLLPISVIGEPVAGAKRIPFGQCDKGGRWAKVNLYDLSPYEQTLYIDADTRVHQFLDAGFDMLADGWDMVITASGHQGSDMLWHLDEEDREATLREVGPMLQLQGGLFWFARNERIKRFFEAWRTEWLRFQGQDQGALLRALYRSPLRVWLLGRPWNGGAVVGHRFGFARKAA